MDLFSKKFKTLRVIFFTSWVSCIPGQIVQLLGQLITMNFGFFLHSPLNAQDLQFLFLSLQADGKKVRQWRHKLTPKEFRESDFFNMSFWIIFPCFFWKKSIWQSFVRKATILLVFLLCSFTLSLHLLSAIDSNPLLSVRALVRVFYFKHNFEFNSEKK